MKLLFPSERLSRYFEAIVVAVLQLLLIVVIVIAVADLWFILGKSLLSGRLSELQSVPDLQRALQRTLAGVLLILLGLEMMEALRTYFSEHRVKVEIILVLALIAVGRHIIQLDFEHLDGIMLVGIAALVIALSGGLVLFRGTVLSWPTRRGATQGATKDTPSTDGR
jgi:uncharacterized membrane protein (DUF373 family)